MRDQRDVCCCAKMLACHRWCHTRPRHRTAITWSTMCCLSQIDRSKHDQLNLPLYLFCCFFLQGVMVLELMGPLNLRQHVLEANPAWVLSQSHHFLSSPLLFSKCKLLHWFECPWRLLLWWCLSHSPAPHPTPLPLVRPKPPTAEIQESLLQMTKDVANGMIYLASRSFVHRVSLQGVWEGASEREWKIQRERERERERETERDREREKERGGGGGRESEWERERWKEEGRGRERVSESKREWAWEGREGKLQTPNCMALGRPGGARLSGLLFCFILGSGCTEYSNWPQWNMQGEVLTLSPSAQSKTDRIRSIEKTSLTANYKGEPPLVCHSCP